MARYRVNNLGGGITDNLHVLTIRFPKDLHALVEHEADLHRQSVAEFIRESVRRRLNLTNRPLP